MADFIVLLLHHFFSAIMIWLMSSIARLFYWNYDLAYFFYFNCFTAIIIWLILFDFYHTTVLYQLWFGWYLPLHHCFIEITIWLISFIAPLFCCNYDLVDLFYCTTVLLRLWFAWVLLLQDGCIAVINWRPSCFAPLFTANMILLILFDFYHTTALLQL